ncbi:MAG: alpha/beta hydrolase family esterase [Candidatus Kapaibacteriota bacterium]
MVNLKTLTYYAISFFFISLFMSCGTVRLSKEHRSTLQTNQHINIDGFTRTFHVYNPSQSHNKPIVFLFHGNGGSADGIAGLKKVKAPYLPWFDIAKKEGLILVIPDGMIGPEKSQGWNDCRNDAPRIPSTDDVEFINVLLDTLQKSLRYDTRKVYMVGTSNGGHFVMRLAQEIPHRMTAFASIISTYAASSKCTSSSVPVSALFMNGTADPLIPYTGGKTENGSIISTDSIISYWIYRNGTNKQPTISQFPSKGNTKVVSFHYQHGMNDTEVMLYKVENGGHIEPSKRERYSFLWTSFVGAQNEDIESAEEIWSFFKEKIRK